MAQPAGPAVEKGVPAAQAGSEARQAGSEARQAGSEARRAVLEVLRAQPALQSAAVEHPEPQSAELGVEFPRWEELAWWVEGLPAG